MKHNLRTKAQLVFFMIAFLSSTSVIWGTTNLNKRAFKPMVASHIAIPPRSQEVPIPADGDCLYKSIMVAYLLPVVNDADLFNARLAMLIGENTIIPTEETKSDKGDENKDDNKDDSKMDINQVWDAVKIRQHFLNLRLSNLKYCLRQYPFPTLVPYMKAHIGIKKNKVDQDKSKEWGGPQEIQTIANRLQVTIEEYTPNPDDNNNTLTEPICIQPKQRKAFLTLRIVRDNPTKEEAVNLVEDKDMQRAKALSLKDAQHRQHYRTLLNKTVIYHLQDKFEQPKVNPINNVVNPLPNQWDRKEPKPRKSHAGSTINIPKNLRELQWSTSPYECAVLSGHIYNSDIKEGQQVTIKLDNDEKARHFPNWKVYKTLLPQHKGYKAIIYHNRTKRQLVLAYRGSKSKWSKDARSDWFTNLQGIVRNKRGYQDKDILLAINSLQEAIFAQEQGKTYACTITGHSLGGWLAQLTVLLAHKYQNNEKYRIAQHIKIITFDSPGAKRAMLTMLQDPDKKNIINHFDITNYYSAPNLVNSLHSSPGSRYRIIFKDFNKLSPISHTMKSHSIDCFIESFHVRGGYPKRCDVVKKWPTNAEEYGKVLAFIAKYKLPYLDTDFLSSESLYDMGNIASINYETSAYDSSFLHARHIPERLRKWLLSQENPDISLSLVYYLAPAQENKEFWHTKTTFHSHCIVDFLRSFQINPAPSFLVFFTEAKNLKKRIRQSQKCLHNLPKVDQDVEPISRSQAILDIALLLHADRLARFYCQYHYFHDQYLPHDILTCIMEYLSQRCCIIYGYPGRGKSTLARLYGHEHLKRGTYQHVWWIDVTTLNDSLQQVINTLKGSKHSHHMPAEEQRKKYVKKALEHLSGWLLIIDNVTNIHAIKNLIPSRGGHILITARDRRSIWNHLGIRYEIGKLSEEHAERFITKLAPPKSKQEKSEVPALCKALHRTPLALRNAGYSIRNQTNSAQPYAEYLNYIKNMSMLPTGQEETEKEHKETIGATYLRSINQIAMCEKDSARETLHVLTIMAYLDAYGLTPDFIAQIAPWQSGWFKYYLGNPIGTATGDKGIKTLVKYGIYSNQEYRIHEFCQDTTRVWIEKTLKSRESKTPKQYKLMHKLFPYGCGSISLAAVKLLENVQQSATPQSPLRLIGIDHARTLMKYVRYNGSLRNRLLCVIAHLQAQAYPLDLYIAPQSKAKEQKKPCDMHKQVFSFIKSRHSLFGKKVTPFGFKTYSPLLLIKGSAGTGKSTYAAYLTQELVKTYNNAKIWARIPVFIFLPAYVQKNGQLPADLISRVLVNYGMTNASIKQLQQAAQEDKQPLVFIMDSYDEAHLQQNIYTHCQLADWGIKYSKFIITCRTNYLDEMPQAAYYRQGQLFSLNDWQAREVNICPFDATQINRYIKEFVKTDYNEAKEEFSYYEKRLTPTLRKMADTPFMLCMILLSMPKIQGSTPSLYDVYDALTKVWLDREMRKPSTQVSRTTILDFCRALAFEMWENKVYNLKKDNNQIAHFFKQPQFVHAPLRITSNQGYAFLQPSYRDFFAAQYIIAHPIKKGQIHQKVLNRDLIIFLTKGMYVYAKQALAAQCWQTVNEARKNKNSGIAAAYCLQLLYYMNPNSLQHKDLSGINLQGGKLAGLDLSSANLTGANLSGQNLTQVKFPKDLSNCNLTGAQLPKDLSNCNLTGANLSGQNLTQVKLPKDLSNCNFTGAQLPKDLSNCNLTGAQLPKDLSNYNLTGSNLSGQNLNQVKLPKDLSNCNLTGAQLPKDLSNYNLTGANLSGQNLNQVKLPKDLSNCNLTGANLSGQNLTKVKLPKDLSSMNVQGVNFTGHTFTHTNLTYTDLANIILTNTTCDYQQAFQDNSIKNELKGGDWYKNNLPKDLKSIAQVYPKLNNNTHKAKLLQVASAFSQLPFYEGTEFYIKVAYWSCELVQLKKVLGNPYGQQLVCSLQSNLEWDANNYCWKTNYPQDKVNIEGKAPHADFDTYLKEFTNGLTKYQCKSKDNYGFRWYKEGITKNIEGLAATYPHIKEKQLQEEARNIAQALSKSYQIQKGAFLNHYLFFQHRLIRLKKSVGVGVKNKVYYRISVMVDIGINSWSRGKK